MIGILAISSFTISMIPVGILGVLLVLTGLWPRRRGDTPYCRKCKYNLTGIPSNRCPECGNATDKRGVVVGIRKRKPIRGILGLLLLCPLIGIVYDEAIVFDWFAHQPTSWLLWELESNDELLACRASNELYCRFNGRKLSLSEQSRFVDAILGWEGTLFATAKVIGASMVFIPCYGEKVLAETYREGLMSDSQIDEYFRQIRESKLINVTAILEVPSGAERTQSKLIDLLLDFQGRYGERNVFGESLQRYVDFLGNCYLRELMTEVQEERFLRQIVFFKLKVSPRVVAGGSLFYELTQTVQCPSPPWRIEIEEGFLIMGDTTIGKSEYTVDYTSSTDPVMYSGSIPCDLPAGHYELIFKVHVLIRCGDTDNWFSTKLLDSRDVCVRREFEVLSKLPSE